MQRTVAFTYISVRFSSVLIIALSILGMATMVFATRWGIGTSPDSVAYIGAARSFVHGQGLRVPYGEAINDPMTHHAPLYPMLLALPGVFHVDPVISAKMWGILLFGANLLMAGKIMQTVFHDSTTIPVWGTFFVLTASPMLDVHVMAWTESLFLLLELSGLFLLAGYLAVPRKLFLAAASLLIGLAFLTRYSGASLVIAGGLILLLWGARRWKEKFMDLILFGSISCLPISIWLLRNLLVAGTATNRQFVFHPIGRGHLWQSLYTMSSWLWISASTPDILKIIPWLVILASGILVFLAFWRQGRIDHALPRLTEAPRVTYFLGVLIIFSAVNTVFTAASLSFFDANTPLLPSLLVFGRPSG